MPVWLAALRDLVADASPLRRVAFALLVLLPLAALAMAYLRVASVDYRILYAQLSDRAGGEVIAALEQLDIPYRLAASDGSIEVPAGELHNARYRLAARGLPRSDEAARDDSVHAPGFGASSLQEQQRFQRALEQDLARSIQSLDAVELARVHLALPKVSPFLRDGPVATAAVLVRLRHDAQLSPEQVAAIQALVAAGVPRLQPTNVQVFDPDGVLTGSTPSLVSPPREALEREIAERVLAVLTPWLGRDRVSVEVSATLESTAGQQGAEPARSASAPDATPSSPAARVQRIDTIVILNFDADAATLQRAEAMTERTLGLDRARGDRLSVYALPAAMAGEAAATAPGAVPPVATRPPAQDFRGWGLAAALVLLLVLLVAAGRRRRAAAAAGAAVADDFDAALAAARSRALADPRVVADVVKLWMRA